MDNQQQGFSFYFNFRRVTNCELEHLKVLYKDVDGGEEIIKGILRDKEWFESQFDSVVE